jgi:predicted ATPase
LRGWRASGRTYDATVTEPTGDPQLHVLDGVRWRGAAVTGERQQRLLAALVEAGSTGATTGRLATEVWHDDPPADPVRALQVVVSRTRSMTSPDVVVRSDAGYRLGLAPADVDHLRLLDRARRAGAAAHGEDWATTLEEARAVVETAVADRDADDALGRIAAEARNCQRACRRLVALASGRLGRHAVALPQLEAEAALAPDDEDVLVALLRSLAATAGAAAALSRYEQHRTDLVDRLGTDPGPALQRLHAELLAADQPVRAGIRYDATSLVGRDADLAALRALVSTGRVTSIVGPGGLGKTRLAHVLARTTTHPVVHFVELVGVTAPEDLVGEVGSTLGVRDSVTGRRTLTVEQRADVRARMVQQLDTAPTLLVLDNCEHLVGAVADLVAYLVAGARDLHVVTTTRAPLGIAAERVYQLAQLQTPDAVELFRQRALAARPTTVLDDDLVAELVNRLDGLPLAIELAAAKARVMSVPEIARRLENRFALLRGGDRSAPDRHQTLLAVIDWSWNLLAEPERRALRWLSVFHDGFTLDAAETVLGADALESVQDLADQSLLGIVEGEGGLRFRMLETVREFGRMQLVDAGEDAEAAAAHRSWATGYAARQAPLLFSPQQFDGVDALYAEEANLADALRQALAEPDPAAVVQLLTALGPYWSVRGDHPRMMALAPAICSALSGWTPPDELADATRIALAVTTTNTMITPGGTPAEISALLERLGPGSDPRVAALVRTVGSYDPQDPAGFLDRLEQHAVSGERHLALSAYQWLSHARENAGDVDEALRAAERALELAEPEDGPWTAAILRTQLGQLAMQVGDTARAVEHGRAALPVLERLHANDDTLQIKSLLSLAALKDGDLERAGRELEALDRTDLPEAVFGGRLVIDLGLAELALARGEVAAGLTGYRRAVERVRTLHFPGLEMSGLEPWVLFGESAALTAFAHHAVAPDDAAYGEDLRTTLADRVVRSMSPENPHLDYPVCGLGLFALGSWGLLRDALPPADAVRLLVLADRFGYNRTIPTMAWERAVEACADRAPDLLAPLRAEYGDRRGQDLLEDTRKFVDSLES